jgi:UDP-GlcNAc:undecaprenyl-phosphate GlcNAc-1-phosphate transferase
LQIAAALIPVFSGIRIEVFSNPLPFTGTEWLILKELSIPITVIWIVLVTNAVNLIDGLDGLAVGVSGIGSVAMLVIAMLVSEGNVAVIMAALAGACLGFIPYNLNPAKIFAGDTGALLLGFVLSTMSVIGLFKTYAIVSFLLPFLVLALPLFDTGFAIVRRLAHGQSPMHPDRGHVHHRLIDMGLSQKQAVAILYFVSIIFGLAAVVLTTNGPMKVLVLVLAAVAVGTIAYLIIAGSHKHHHPPEGMPPAAPAPPENEKKP